MSWFVKVERAELGCTRREGSEPLVSRGRPVSHLEVLVQGKGCLGLWTALLALMDICLGVLPLVLSLDGWMGGWMHGWIDGWIDGQL